MFNYSFNPREYNEILQFVTLFLLVVIGSMLYYMSDSTEKLQNDLSELELSCPECPEHPDIPSCPKCPDLTCTEEGKCPDCICPNNEHSCPKCPDSSHTCPQCPAPPHCPTVEEIVGGIFPGRNTGITSGGKYFDIQANDNYELLPDYDFYQPMNAFPTDSILDPLHTGNVRVPTDSIDNSIDNYNINTSGSRSLVSIPGMNMALPGMNTSPSSTWGAGTTRTAGGLSPLDRQVAAARAAAPPGSPISQATIDAITQAQANRDNRSGDRRSDMTSGLGD